MEQSKYRTIILLLVITGTVAIILSIGGNHWIESSDNHRGLWRSCKKGKDCEDMSKDDLPFYIPIVRGLSLFGVIVLVLAVMYYIAMVARPKSFGSFCLSIFLGIAGVATIIGLSVYTYFTNDLFTNSIRYHWSYFTGWFGVTLIVIACAMTCQDSRRSSNKGNDLLI